MFLIYKQCLLTSRWFEHAWSETNDMVWNYRWTLRFYTVLIKIDLSCVFLVNQTSILFLFSSFHYWPIVYFIYTFPIVILFLLYFIYFFLHFILLFLFLYFWAAGNWSYTQIKQTIKKNVELTLKPSGILYAWFKYLEIRGVQLDNSFSTRHPFFFNRKDRSVVIRVPQKMSN